jgi:dynactin complex subunit
MSAKNKTDQAAKTNKKLIGGIKQINRKLFDLEMKIDTIEYHSENKSTRNWRLQKFLSKVAIGIFVALQLAAITKYLFGL